jgi:hypothetical protein
MTKSLLSTLLAAAILGCSAQSSTKSDHKKELFCKMLGFIKNNQIDSTKKYIYIDDEAYFLFNFRGGNTIMNEFKPDIDSIKVTDSISVNGIEVYTYNLNFYRNDSVLANIEMRFLSDKLLSQLFCHPEVKIVDAVDTNEILDLFRK